MSPENPLDIDYHSHERVQKLIHTIQFCIEDISLAFDRWEEPYITGPGLYVAIFSGHAVRDHADPMGDNQWPVSECRDVLEDVDEFYEATNEVARTRDGAVVVSVDGIVQEQMVRFRDSPSEPSGTTHRSVRYADWVGPKYQSAIKVTVREEVVRLSPSAK